MAINLNNLTKEDGVWVEYDDDVSFKIRHLIPPKVAAMRKKYVTKKRKAGVLEENISDANQTKFDEELFDYILEDWKGVVIGNEAAECNKENKAKLMTNSINISLFVLEKSREIHETDLEIQADEVKN